MNVTIKDNIKDNLLKQQNISLATRMDYYKRICKDQKSLLSQLQEREIRYQKFFSFLETSWRGFLTRNLRIQSIIKKKGVLESKYINAFQLLDDAFHSQQLFQNAQSDKMQIATKFDQFLRSVENIYLEISMEHQQYMENLQINADPYVEESDYLRSLVQNLKDSAQWNKTISDSLLKSEKLRERKLNDLDGQLAFQTVYQLQQLLSESRRENETLTRRLRIVTGAQFKDENDNFDCVCGGLPGRIPMPPQVIQQPRNNVPQVQSLLARAVRSRIKINSEEENYHFDLTLSEMKDLEYILMNYFTVQQKNEVLLAQQVTQQKSLTQLEAQYRELELSTQYKEDKFAESETYKFLKTHNMTLVEQFSLLIGTIQNYQQQYQELVYSKQKDMLQMQKYYEHELQRIVTEVPQVQREEVSQVPQQEIDQFLINIRERNYQLDRVIDALKKELESARKLYADAREQINDLTIKREEAASRLIELEQKQMVTIDNAQFRHSKHKELIVEIQAILQKNAPHLITKYQDLVTYLKTRDSKVEHLEKEMSKLKQTIDGQKRHQDLMVEDSDLNSKTYDEILTKSKLTEAQLRIKEKNEATLIQEKIAEKSSFENERASLHQKIKQQNEMINRFQIQLQDQQQLLQKYSQEKIHKMETQNDQAQQLEAMKIKLQQCMIELHQSQIEKECIQKKIHKAELINQDYIQEKNTALSKILDLETQIQQLESQLNNPAYLEQTKGYLILKQGELSSANCLTKVKQTASCSQCTFNLKEVIISKCMHMLCKCCAEQAQFKEKCPICKISINITDIWSTKVQE